MVGRISVGGMINLPMVVPQPPINLPMVVPQPPKEGDSCSIPWCAVECDRKQCVSCDCGDCDCCIHPPCKSCDMWWENFTGKYQGRGLKR